MVRDTQSDDADESGDGIPAAVDTGSHSRREVLTKAIAGSVAFLVGVSGTSGSVTAFQDDEEDAAVDFQVQESDGETVTVESVTLPDGGFVVIHDMGLVDGDGIESVIGVSEFLDAGEEENVDVDLFDVPGAEFDQSELTEDTPLVAMAHRDTDDDEEFGFVERGGGEDGPYMDGDRPVVDQGFVLIGE